MSNNLAIGLGVGLGGGALVILLVVVLCKRKSGASNSTRPARTSHTKMKESPAQEKAVAATKPRPLSEVQNEGNRGSMYSTGPGTSPPPTRMAAKTDEEAVTNNDVVGGVAVAGEEASGTAVAADDNDVMSRFKRSNRLGLEGLRDIVDDQIKLHDEFQRIPINNADPNSLPPNVNHKNRYVNILPNKESRVPLEQVGDDTTSTYINANYVRGDLGAPNVYVCTQGPLPQTVIDFWRLMWELKSPVIVMATALEERGKQKCARYWPDASVAPRVKYGDIVVSVVREEATDVYDFTELAVSLGGEERHIGHFWFRAWPDHGVPKNTKAILTFLAAVRSYDAESPLKGPQVIHCSAGIGRTGTFSAVDIGMRSLDRTGSVDVLNIVARLREDRGGMVQTQEQYCFIYESLLDYLESKSD